MFILLLTLMLTLFIFISLLRGSMLHKSDTNNRYLYWTLVLHATHISVKQINQRSVSDLLLKLITCCLFLDFASNNLQTIYITRGPHKILLSNTVFCQHGDNRRMDMQQDSKKMSKESSTIQSETHELKMQLEFSGERQCSFSILLGISTQLLLTHFPEGSLEITITTYPTFIMDSSCQVKKMEDTTVLEEMLLLL